MRGPAAVLCEGPSILNVTPETLAGQLVIAVNNAIRHVPHRFDFWASQDPMDRYELHSGAFLRSIPATVYGRPVALLNRAQADAQPGPPALTAWERRSLEVEATNLELYEAGIGYTHALPTVAVAAMYARRHGYAPVTIYGADMKGHGSPLTPWCPYDPGSAASLARWNRERYLLAQIVAGWPAVHLHRAD